MRPRIVKYGREWLCWSPAIFGGRIVGFGKTKEEAFKNWQRTAQP